LSLFTPLVDSRRRGKVSWKPQVFGRLTPTHCRRMTKAADADEHKIKVLNVAGPRLSGWKEGYAFARAVMAAIISKAGT
jgi:hypothetical protein